MKEQWTLTNERVTDFEYSRFKNFNMLITDKMFERLEEIVGKKKVKEIIEMIVCQSCPVLGKVKISLSGWKLFQHLISDEEITNTKKQKETKMFKNGKEYKHYHHFVSICISRNEYFAIMELHHRINTFSMALIIRMMVEIFIVLYEKYKDTNVALSKIEEMIFNSAKMKIFIFSIDKRRNR